jgi:GAF domain-containing protein
VTRSGQPRVALDVGADAVFFNNPYLPETRSEIALPLRAGFDIIGALDVQSLETNAFADEDINILSVLADQVSIAIQNARSYQQSREALEQAELSAAQMIEQQWSQFLGRQNIKQYHFDGVDARQSAATNDKQTHNLAIPLILRGAKIGTLRLTATDPDREWDEDEIAIAQAAAERTALAIENARLLLEAQKRAAKERTIGEISAKIGNSISLERILETAIQELGSTLPGADVAIQFTEPSEQK